MGRGTWDVGQGTWGMGRGAGDMKRHARMLAAAAVVVLALPVVASGQHPRRIVSLVPSATEILFAIGAGPRVIGVGSFDTYPPEVAALPRVGALIDPDIERILSLRPDLMVCYASQTDLRTQLERAGIAVYPYRHGTLDDISATVRQLGAAVGRPRESAALAARLDADLQAVRRSVAGRRKPRVMLVIGRAPGALRAISASGGYGFLHDLVELAGGLNVLADVERESIGISSEIILARAPEVIIELRYSDTPSAESRTRERLAWDALPGVPAVRSGRVVLLYGGELVVPGPRVATTALAFARAIHPEVER